MYFDGWDPSIVPVKMNKEQFLERVRHEFRYDVEGGVERLVQTVLQALRRHVTDGEWDDIVSGMPRDLAAALA
jgi:uncharacterized protein (DUF2267 family)